MGIRIQSWLSLMLENARVKRLSRIVGKWVRELPKSVRLCSRNQIIWNSKKYNGPISSIPKNGTPQSYGQREKMTKCIWITSTSKVFRLFEETIRLTCEKYAKNSSMLS